MVHFKRLFSVILILLLVASCSKKEGSTVSKIKIFSSAFSTGVIGTRANNGLILYGHSNDGKVFTKKITNDFIELSFPNGVWSFYAVAWEIAGGEAVDTGLRGRVSCAKSLGVPLSGAEVAISLTLSNNNCDTSFHPNSEVVAGDKTLAAITINSCKSIANISGVADGPLCGFSQGTTDNKGYATFVRLVVPEYSNFGNGFNPAIRSRCFAIESNNANGLATSETSFINSINIPKPGGNGFNPYFQIFYTKNGCDESNGFTTIPLNNSTKQKSFISAAVSTQSKENIFLETDSAPICQGPRLDPSFFASGKGTASLPYTVCTPTQYALINTLYNDGTINARAASFDLLANLNFNLSSIQPIGDNITPFSGNFNGRNNRIENFRINCPAAAEDGFGLFRSTSGGFFSDLIINRGVIDCENDLFVNNKIGLLAGLSSNNTFKNIKAFGHTSGDSWVGGIVGYAANNSKFDDVHVEGGMNGTYSVGGIAGAVTGTTTQDFIFRSSFSGEISSHCSSGTICDSIVGGLVGDAFYTSSQGSIRESTAKLKRLEGSKILGGLVGRTNLINIYDSIVTGVMSSDAFTDGTANKVKMGGLVGETEMGIFQRNIVVMIKRSNRAIADTSEGSIAGWVTVTSPTCLSTALGRNFAVGSNDYVISCNTDSAVLLSALTDVTTYSTSAATFVTDYPQFSWLLTDQGAGGDIPRLAWEAGKEASVSYLKRECSGLYTTAAGSGTAADPFTICSAAQFNSMTTGNYYKLKKNLLFGGTAITPKPAGIYLLDGDGHGLIDFQINVTSVGNTGLFQELASGSEIKNLALIFGKLSTTSEYIAGAGIYSVGVLAGSNHGVIKNIVTEENSASFPILSLLNGSTTFIAGGLVGTNQATGVITDSELDSSVSFKRLKNTGYPLFAGGISGKNAGSISIVRSDGKVERSMGDFYSAPAGLSASPGACASSGEYLRNTDSPGQYFVCNVSLSWVLTYPTSSAEVIGGIVGENTGSISQVENEALFTIKDHDTNTNGNLGPFVGVNATAASITDSVLRGSVDFAFYGPVNKVVAQNNGSISRFIFKPSYLSTNFDITTANVFQGLYTDAICLFGGGGTNCLPSSTTISYTDPTLTIGANYSWSVGTDFINPNNNTWLFENGKISLMRVGGNFDKLGKGF